VTEPAARSRHIPVLGREVLTSLQPREGGTYVDATFGAGGYSRAILETPQTRVIGIDRDRTAIAGGFELVEQLAAAGKMKPAGLKEMAAAKADGRWDKAYDSPSKMTVPADFLRELTKNKKAQLFFKTLNKANKYAIAWRLQTAAKPEIRDRRMKTIIAMLAKGKAFH